MHQNWNELVALCQKINHDSRRLAALRRELADLGIGPPVLSPDFGGERPAPVGTERQG